MSLTETALLLNVAATGMMIGVIWFVQVVHYPLLARVGRPGYPAYAGAHASRTTLVVAPPMLVEAATGAWLALHPPAGAPAWVFRAGLALIAVVWLSTFLLQVPRHRVLDRGFDEAAAPRAGGGELDPHRRVDRARAPAASCADAPPHPHLIRHFA